MAFAYHNELRAADEGRPRGENVTDELRAAMTAAEEGVKRGEDVTEILDDINILAPKRMKEWKNDKKFLKKEIDEMRDEIKKDEEEITMAYDKAAIVIAKIETHRKNGRSRTWWVERELVELRRLNEFSKMMKYRIALFKKAIVVHSHSHNETIAKANKHLNKFLSMRDDWDVAACKYGVDKFNPKRWGLITLTISLAQWIKTATFVAELARPISDA